MRSGRMQRAWVVLAAGAALGVTWMGPAEGHDVVLAAQQQTHPPQMPTMPEAEQPSAVPDSVRARIDQERVHAANDDRHKRLSEDADKLITLSNELKTDVNNTSKDELSMEVIRKAAEIEKLAHDVQNRMKN